MDAELDAEAAQHEQPEHHHQREIESAEARGVELRERKVERAAGGEQPDFVAVPDGADRAQDLAALVVGFGRHQIDRARAEIESIEHDVCRDHNCDDPEPEGCHLHLPCAAGGFPARSGSPSGPFSISRRTRNKNRMHITVYMPMNPSSVNRPLPAETVLEYPSDVRISP